MSNDIDSCSSHDTIYEVEPSSKPRSPIQFIEENDMFYNETNAEEARKHFSRSKSDASALQKHAKTAKIRTGSAKTVRHGLINRSDPSQVSFQEQSEWLEKLVEDEVEANMNKDSTKKVEKRQSTGKPFFKTIFGIYLTIYGIYLTLYGIYLTIHEKRQSTGKPFF